jgi:hypothetical protein
MSRRQFERPFCRWAKNSKCKVRVKWFSQCSKSALSTIPSSIQRTFDGWRNIRRFQRDHFNSNRIGDGANPPLRKSFGTFTFENGSKFKMSGQINLRSELNLVPEIQVEGIGPVLPI